MAEIKAYAGYYVKQDIRMSSSSGAVFSSLAEYVLEQKGIVYGVKMSEDCYSAEFTRVEDKVGLMEIRGSKYLQAKIGNTYKQVREDLISGKLVLFSGTGCQINGLKTFLGKVYEKLICVDVICHGVPSPALWKKYVQYQEQKNGGKLKYINFRCKNEKWLDFRMSTVLDKIPYKEQKKMYIPKEKDSYMKMFLQDYCLRPSCYNCIAKTMKMSDLTIADFWGINDVIPEMNDGIGTSLILLRTDKGRKIFNIISGDLKTKEVSYEEGVKNNPSEYQSCCKPPQREQFFNNMCSMSFENLEKKYISPIKIPLKSRVRRKIKNIIKFMLNGEEKCKNNEDYGLLFVFHI